MVKSIDGAAFEKIAETCEFDGKEPLFVERTIAISIRVWDESRLTAPPSPSTRGTFSAVTQSTRRWWRQRRLKSYVCEKRPIKETSCFVKSNVYVWKETLGDAASMMKAAPSTVVFMWKETHKRDLMFRQKKRVCVERDLERRSVDGEGSAVKSRTYVKRHL